MGTYLGQNFLIDSKVRQYIADKISALYQISGCDALIEIGPGKGSITKLIHGISQNLFIIEKDKILIPNLLVLEGGKFQIPNSKLIEGDVLDIDVEKILKDGGLSPQKTLIVGNLPYYITSPILRKFFDGENPGFVGGIFMVQDEVAQKLRSDAKKKSYLRWLLNFAYDVTYLKGVPAKCFKPIPKVKSALIELRIKDEGLRIEWNGFVEFLELFAPFSRKTLGAIQKIIKKKSDKIFTISESLQKKRLEELTWDDLTTILLSDEGRVTSYE